MKQENQNEKTISNFIEVNGIGTIATKNGYQDTFVYGYFKKYRWFFIVHKDLDNPEFVTVSEASTGRLLKEESYYTVEDALHFALPFIREKHYYFATSVGDVLVETQTNLLKRNTTNLQTLAIDTILWL